MGTENDDLEKRYARLSDLELIQLYKAGGLTDEATTALSKALSARGLDVSKADEIISEQSNQQIQEYLTSSPKPIPKIWIGFVLVGASIVAEFYDIYAGFNKAGVSTVFYFCGFLYWLFCVNRFHVVLRHISLGAYPISPNKAVGFHFIPLYNLYWVYEWSNALVEFLRQKNNIKMIPGWAIGLLLLTSLLAGKFVDGAVGLTLIFCTFSYMAAKLRQAVHRFTESPEMANKVIQPPSQLSGWTAC